jgi:replicative DNA helicase
MEKNLPLESEGAVLDAVLNELQKESAVKEIAGWATGFDNLSRALDGVRPGLYLLVGAPAIGKTAFARQLLDQVALHNRTTGMFFTFAETKKELRIRTLARLSGLDQREIRRGSAYLLHWYGVPRLAAGEATDLPPSWEKLKRAAEEASSWLDLVYLVECQRSTTVNEIEAQIAELRAQTGSEQMMIVIDDCQRLGAADQPLGARLPIVTEQLQQTAKSLNVPVLAVWPNLDSGDSTPAQSWSEKVASADVILVMETDSDRSKKLTEPNQAIILHIVKNRGGEKGKLAYDFYPAFSKFVEIESS